MKGYIILTTKERYGFVGKYLPGRETSNWHYYESDDGKILHFRKEHMICVEELPLPKD